MMKLTKKEIPFIGAINILNTGIFRKKVGLKEQFVYINPKMAHILGYEEDELYEIPLDEIFVDPRKLVQMEKQALKKGFLKEEDLVLRPKDHQNILCSISLAVVKDKDSDDCFVDGIIEDVAASRKTEKDFQESKELFKTVFNNSAVAIVVADQKEKIIAWNPFSEIMLGLTQQDLFNKPIKELFPVRELKKLNALSSRYKDIISDIETRVFKKDKNVLEVNLSLSRIRDNTGKVIGSIRIMHDMTKQKDAERKIKESENKIRTILDNSAIAITLTDEKERLVTWNQYTEKILGMHKGDLFQRPISSLYPSNEWEKIRGANIRQSGSSHHIETKVIRKDGKVIDVELSVNVLKDSNNKVAGSVGIMQDITKQKRAQQNLLQAKKAAEDASSAKTMFLANMSHEVRTPMNTIMGMVDLTLDTDLSEEQRDNMLTIKNAADILLGLLNDILDLSRVEAGKIQLEQIELNLRNIVQSVCKGLAVLARNKGLRLEWEVADNVPRIIFADPVRIRQVLVNLINNAIKFTFKGSIVTKVRAVSKTDSECDLEFSVADQGVGIPQNKVDKIFDVFTQADASTTRRFGGTGLGLSICRKLVEMMGGGIWVESEEFKGSTFLFTGKLKIAVGSAEVDGEESIEDALIDALPKKQLKHLSILLAEDNIVNQKIAVRMLEKRGWEVKAASNGKQVLELLDKEDFDLILMDAQMPVLDGFEATKMIRKREEASGGHIPIIALTARVMAGDRKKCLDSGMDGYVSKPIDRKKLYEAVENFFQKRKVQ